MDTIGLILIGLSFLLLFFMSASTSTPLIDPAPTGPATGSHQARFWDRTARRYATEPIADMAGYEATLRRVQGLLAPGHEVLELGCGTGNTALRLAPAAGRMLATDVSPAMIAIAQARQAAQPAPQLRFAVASADAPALPDGAFDRVLAFNLLHLVDRLDATLAHVSRLLKPGGLLVSKTPCLAEMNPLIPHLMVPLMRALGRAPRVASFGEADLRAAMERQGLRIEAVERQGTRGKDWRVFIVASKPLHPPGPG